MGTVEIIEDVRGEPRSTEGGVRCYFVARGDHEAVREAMTRVGVEVDDRVMKAASHPEARRAVHPEVHGRDGTLVASLCGTTPSLALSTWVLVAGRAGLVVIGEHDAGEEIRAAVRASPETGPHELLSVAVLGLARSVAAALEQLPDVASALDSSIGGFSRAGERAEIRVLRGQLFLLQETFAAQAELLGEDEELPVFVGEGGAQPLRRARSIFDFGRGTCARLYALAGDLLAEQNAVVNERLTLVSTFFLPLTVSTGFFGMNFGWMTDRIGGPTAFAVLGIGVPLLTTIVTLVVVRRLGASGS